MTPPATDRVLLQTHSAITMLDLIARHVSRGYRLETLWRDRSWVLWSRYHARLVRPAPTTVSLIIGPVSTRSSRAC